MFDLLGGEPAAVALTLYTDSFVIKGQLRSRKGRISDILNDADEEYLVLTDAMVDEYGSRSMATRTDFAQVNLDAVLFAVADTEVESRPDLRTQKVPEQAMISIPPFRVIGRVHVLPERGLGEALAELRGRFIPVTEATYWSDVVGEARQTAPMVAINHRRAQILAPHREVDPWAGVDRSVAGATTAGATAGSATATSGSAPATSPDPAWPEADRPPG